MLLKERFSNDKPATERFIPLLLTYLRQHALEILHVVMGIPPDHAARDLHAFSQGIVTAFVGDDDISALGECWNHARRRGKRLGVQDTGRDAEEGGDICFGLHVDILRAVEARRATRADTMSAQGFDGAALEILVGDEVVVIVGCEIGDGVAAGELGLDGGRTANLQSAMTFRIHLDGSPA